jgi:predicted ATPase
MFRISNVLISSGPQNTSESTLNLKRINILVGPNNSGKSTLLKDIESWFNQESPRMKLVKNVEISMSDGLDDYQEFERDILEFEDGERIKLGQVVFVPVVKLHLLTEFREGPEWYSLDDIRTEFKHSNIEFFRQHFFRFFVARLDGRSRFQLIDPKQFHIWRTNKTPFNYLSRLYLSTEDQNKLGEIANKEFSHYIYLKKTDSVIDIMLSNIPRVETDHSTLENKKSLPNDALRVSEFGDGVQCFIAICLSILSCPFRVVLIDEPEAYLHPPTAYSLGRHLSTWVKEKHRSLVVATHSSEFLMGCLYSLPSSDVSVTRLTYQDRIGKVKQLDDSEISNFRDDPILRASDVISAFFYSSAVVGEGYEDKTIYQETNSKLLRYDRGINNTVFLNANGKGSVHKITTPLRKIGIPAAAIYDFNVLRTSKESFVTLDLMK